jgi:DNA-binding phage protein
MYKEVLEALTEKACASIRFRVRKEILEESPDIAEYLDEILNDKRVKYVFTWQRADGFLGQSFHGGWIPDAKLKFYNTGAEAALRFLSEMSMPKNYPVVEKGLNTLLKDNWNPDPWKWATVYEPEIGLFGIDHVRAVVFSYFGIEEHDFIKTEIQRALGIINRVTEISSIRNITGTYQNKLYFNKGIPLPDIYHLKLLAFTKGWRNSKSTSALAKALKQLIELSPLPQIYIKSGGQLIAPAGIFPQDLKKNLIDFTPKDWFPWFHTIELFARMGIVKQIPALIQQVSNLKEILQEGNGFFPVKPSGRSFEKWSVYIGLALEDSWRSDRWKYDLTFRALLILKYAGML